MLRRKTALYALLSLYDIATNAPQATGGKGLRAGDIAERYGLPRAYAAKIMSQLASAGILHSDRGPRGGFRLQHNPSDITLQSIFQAVGAIESFDEEVMLNSLPDPIAESLRGVTARISDELAQSLEGMTLQDLLVRENDSVSAVG